MPASFNSATTSTRRRQLRSLTDRCEVMLSIAVWAAAAGAKYPSSSRATLNSDGRRRGTHLPHPSCTLP